MHSVDLPLIDLERYAPGRSFYAVFRDGIRSVAEHRQGFYELMHVLSGNGIHRLNGQDWRLRRGQTWCIGVDDRHAISPTAPELNWINVAVPRVHWNAFITLTSAEIPGPVWEGFARDPFDAALLKYNRGENGWALIEFLEAVLGSPVVPQVGPVWLSDFLAELETPAGLRMEVGDLRERACVSTAHFSRSVQKHCGVSPSKLMHRKRLEYASHLLISSPLSIAEVAGDCGFQSLTYFHREFRRAYGQTPLCYRATARGSVDF